MDTDMSIEAVKKSIEQLEVDVNILPQSMETKILEKLLGVPLLVQGIVVDLIRHLVTTEEGNLLALELIYSEHPMEMLKSKEFVIKVAKLIHKNRINHSTPSANRKTNPSNKQVVMGVAALTDINPGLGMITGILLSIPPEHLEVISKHYLLPVLDFIKSYSIDPDSINEGTRNSAFIGREIFQYTALVGLGIGTIALTEVFIGTAAIAACVTIGPTMLLGGLGGLVAVSISRALA